MKVLLLNYEFPPLGGGAANATYHLLHEFAHRTDLTVTLITSAVGPARREQLSDNVTVHFLDIGKDRSLHYQSNIELLKYSWKAWRYAKRLLREYQFDVLHAFFGIPCGLIARKLGVPYVVSLRGSDVPGYSARYALADKLLFRRLSRRVWRDSGAVVANSQGLRALALNTSSEEKIGVIPNGVDTVAFAPETRVPDADGQRHDLRLIFVGRLIPRKGVDLILTAMSDMPGVQLTVVGDGPERSELAYYAQKHGLDVTFMGELQHDQLPVLYRSHDAFAMPSYNEGMSNTVLEAMASGLPVVVTDVGGTAELIHNNGLVVPVADMNALRDAICFLKENHSARRQMGAQSRKIACQYSWTMVASQYIEQYKHTCAFPSEK